MISREGMDSIEFYLGLLKDPRTEPEDEKEAKSALIRRVPQLISAIQELQKDLITSVELTELISEREARLLDKFRDLQAENKRLIKQHKADTISEKHLNCIINELRELNDAK